MSGLSTLGKPTPLEENEQPKPLQRGLSNAEAKALDGRKKALLMDNELYLRQHPEINMLIQDFVQRALEERYGKMHVSSVNLLPALYLGRRFYRRCLVCLPLLTR